MTQDIIVLKYNLLIVKTHIIKSFLNKFSFYTTFNIHSNPQQN